MNSDKHRMQIRDINNWVFRLKKPFKLYKKTEIEKEITVTENEVNALTKQIDQINELERLKRERDRLLEKVENYHSKQKERDTQ